jgi:hypothetical protein
MRRAIALIAVLAGIALLAAAAMPAAAQQGPPGNNGTIKVHAGDTENEPIRANEPHPGCTLHIHGFNFDPNSTGEWSIRSHPPTGNGALVASGSWTANGSGEWRTEVMSAANWPMENGRGHFKVNAKQTSPLAPGGDKQKVFWAECAAPAGGQAGGEQAQGQQQAGQGQAVAGVQQPPQQAAVTAIVEQPAAPAAAAQAQVAGQQMMPVQQLPSTSTVPMAPTLVSGVLMGIAAWMLRRRGEDR